MFANKTGTNFVKKNNIMNAEKRNLIARKFAILRFRRLVMPRVEWHHYLLVATVLFPSIAVAYVIDSPQQAIAIGIWLVLPCKDKQFGNGKKYYWIRQTIFGLGTVICVWAGVA